MKDLKLPPHSVEAEQAVLGGLMLDNQRWDDIADLLTSHDFYSRPHAVIWNVMVELSEQGLPMDLITLSEKMEIEGTLAPAAALRISLSCPKTPPARPISAPMRRSCASAPLCVSWSARQTKLLMLVIPRRGATVASCWIWPNR